MTLNILPASLAVLFSWTALAQPSDPVQVSESGSHVADTVQAFAAVGLQQSRENETMFVCPASFTDCDLERIPNAPFPFALHISGNGVTNEGVRTISQLRNLSVLDLTSTRVTCESDCGFKQMHNLKELSVFGSPVTDIGLQQIARLPRLQTLDLRKTQVAGPGLTEFADHNHLRSLELDLTDKSLPVLSNARLHHA